MARNPTCRICGHEVRYTDRETNEHACGDCGENPCKPSFVRSLWADRWLILFIAAPVAAVLTEPWRH